MCIYVIYNNLIYLSSHISSLGQMRSPLLSLSPSLQSTLITHFQHHLIKMNEVDVSMGLVGMNKMQVGYRCRVFDLSDVMCCWF